VREFAVARFRRRAVGCLALRWSLPHARRWILVAGGQHWSAASRRDAGARSIARYHRGDETNGDLRRPLSLDRPWRELEPWRRRRLESGRHRANRARPLIAETPIPDRMQALQVQDVDTVARDTREALRKESRNVVEARLHASTTRHAEMRTGRTVSRGRQHSLEFDSGLRPSVDLSKESPIRFNLRRLVADEDPIDPTRIRRCICATRAASSWRPLLIVWVLQRLRSLGQY
jgi:hypothetical protein